MIFLLAGMMIGIIPSLIVAGIVLRSERARTGRAGPLSYLVTPLAFTLALFLFWRLLDHCGEACGMLWPLTLVGMAGLGLLVYAAIYAIYTLLLARLLEREAPVSGRYYWASTLAVMVISVEAALHPFARLIGIESRVPFTARILDQDGKPVTGAKVTVRYSTFTKKNGYTTLTTGTDGSFSLEHLRSDSFCLQDIAKDGYTFERFRCFEIRNGALTWRATDQIVGIPEPEQPLTIRACGTTEDLQSPALRYELKRWQGDSKSVEGATITDVLRSSHESPTSKITLIKKITSGLIGEGYSFAMGFQLENGELQPAKEHLMRIAPEDGYLERWEGAPHGHKDWGNYTYRFYVRIRAADGQWHYGRLSASFENDGSELEYWLNPVAGEHRIKPLLDTSGAPSLNDSEEATMHRGSGSLGGADC